MTRLAIIGGGITGLAAAYYAQQYAAESPDFEDLSIEIYEKEPDWGGKIKTHRQDGFVIEGGPDTFLATKPWAVQLCRALGIEDRLRGTNPETRNTYILKNKRLHTLPGGLTMMIPTEIAPMMTTGLLAWPDKLRMGLDFLLPPAPPNGDESLGQFVSRRIGRAAYENLVEPLMSGIYAGDGDRLSLKATFPYLRQLELEHGGLVKGALAVRRQRKRSRNGKAPVPGSRSMFLTPLTGLAEIIESLVDHLEIHAVKMFSGIAILGIQPQGSQYLLVRSDGIETLADAVILASPAFASGELLQVTSPALAKRLEEIEYASTATVSLAYNRSDVPHPLDGYGYIIPRRTGHTALACTWTSSKFPHRSPDDHVLVRVFIGRAGQENEVPWNEAGLQEIAQKEVELTLAIKQPPRSAWVTQWERAMPQYNLGHPERLQQIAIELEQLPGIALAGAGYEGIGIPDCIHSGLQAARQMIAYLNGSREVSSGQLLRQHSKELS